MVINDAIKNNQNKKTLVWVRDFFFQFSDFRENFQKWENYLNLQYKKKFSKFFLSKNRKILLKKIHQLLLGPSNFFKNKLFIGF
jgi:hypothetical protein